MGNQRSRQTEASLSTAAGGELQQPGENPSVAAQLASVQRQRAALSSRQTSDLPQAPAPASALPPIPSDPAGSASSPTEAQDGNAALYASLTRQRQSAALQPRLSWPEPPEPASLLACAPLPVSSLIPIFDRAAASYGLQSSLLRAMAWKESAFQPCAVSRAGAMGLMQLMPETAATLGVSDPFDAEQSIFGGARFLRSLLDRFQNDLALALSAYNAGPARVDRYGGIPPFLETQDYVSSILRSLDASPPD